MIRIRFHPLLLALAALPALCAIAYAAYCSHKLDGWQNEINSLSLSSRSLAKQKEQDAICLVQLKKSDRQYLDKNVEPLSLLEQETKRLQALSYYQTENPHIGQRLEFLKEGKNKVVFAEKERRQTASLQETEAKLIQPVECSDDDLKKILTLLEGISIPPYTLTEGRPLILIKEFDLMKKKNPSSEEVYVIDFEIIKRESL